MDNISKNILKDYYCVEDLLNDYPQLKWFRINKVMATENVEFVTGCNCIVKCKKGILRIQNCTNENEWNDVYMTRSYLNGKYIRINS